VRSGYVIKPWLCFLFSLPLGPHGLNGYNLLLGEDLNFVGLYCLQFCNFQFT
jgi:hypothetical protein